MPLFDSRFNNQVDNNREEEFTISDQDALTKRDINNYLHSHRITHNQIHRHRCKSNHFYDDSVRHHITHNYFR